MIGRLIFVFLSRFFLSALVARRVAFQLAGIAVAVAHVLILVIGCVRGRRLCGRFFHRGLLVGDRFGRRCILGLCFRLFRRLFLGRLLLVLAILASAQAEPRTALFAFSGFLCGGLLCLIGQILIDKTPLTPAKILVTYVVSGVVLGALGIYKYIVAFGGAGATVPLTGFGYLLAKGVAKAVDEMGILGALTGGVTAAAGGITAAIFFGYLVALIFKPKSKS